MMGIEKMFASMIGMTPEEMQQKVADFGAVMERFVSTMETVAADCAEIKLRMEALENDSGSNGPKRSGGSRGKFAIAAPDTGRGNGPADSGGSATA